MSGANNFAGWVIVLLVALSPIPFGGNSPVFWTISATIMGLCALLYMAMALRSGSQLRVPHGQFGLLGLAWLVLCLWLVVQALPLGGLLGGFIVTAKAGQTFVSNSISLSPGSTWLMLIRMISYGIVFFLAAQAGAKETRGQLILTAIFWVIVAHAVFGLVQLTQFDDTLLGMLKSSYVGVATGTFINRNSYATFLAIGLSIGAALLADPFLTRKERNEQFQNRFFAAVMKFGGMLAIFLAILATESRMGLFAGIVGVFIVTLCTMRWQKRALFLIPATIIVALVAGVGVVWIFGQGVLERAISLNGSSAYRGELYNQVSEMISARPWTGYGGGAFEVSFPLYFGPPLTLTLFFDKAHSTYLQLISELGIIGGLIPILVVAALFSRTAAKYMSRPNIVRLAMLGVTTAAAVHSTVDFSLEMEANAYLFAAIIGLSFATGTSARR